MNTYIGRVEEYCRILRRITYRNPASFLELLNLFRVSKLPRA